MWKVAGTALVLALAGTAAMSTTTADGGQKIRVGPGHHDRVDVIDGDGAARTGVRRLAVVSGRGVQLGVSIRDLDATQQTTATGAVVEDVRSGSAAEKAGIQAGDVITEFDGERVRSARHLSRLVSETAEGRTVTAGLLRDGKRLDLQVTPDSGSMTHERGVQERLPKRGFERLPEFEEDDEVRRHLEQAVPAFPDIELFKRFGDGFALITPPGPGRLGVRIQDLSPQLAEYFGAKGGVLVSSVDDGSPASKAGLKAGDVVTAIDGTPVTNAPALADAVRSSEGELTIDYLRDRKAGSTKVTLPPRDEAPGFGRSDGVREITAIRP